MKKRKNVTPKMLANLRPIQKGQVLNPLGAGAPGAQKERELKKITQEIFKDLVELALTSNISALKKIIEDPETPAIRVGIATSLVSAIKNGDWIIIEKIVERIVGKLPVNIDHTSGGDKIATPVKFLIYKNGSEAEEEPTS